MEMMMNDDEIIDWLDLPLDLLSEITDKVTSSSLEDHIRFGCICVQWRSFFLENKNYEQIKLSTLPVLLIPSVDHHHHSNYDDTPGTDGYIRNYYYNPREIWLGLDPKERYTNTRSFYSLSEKKVCDFQLQVPSNLHCRGSSQGWLLLVEECLDGTFPIHLFNPFRSSDKKNKIQLPPLTSGYSVLDSFFLKKFVFARDPLSSSSSSSSLLLSNPTTTNIIDDNDFVVLGLYQFSDWKLGFCRPGDRAWTPLSISNLPIYDIICYKGQFWGILSNGTALAFDISPEPKVTLVLAPHQEDNSHVARYLVESAGDLFNVGRDYSFPHAVGHDDYSTVGFHVFKLDQTTMEWSKANTLDGRMFFLGNNASISLSPSDYFPGSCKLNSIYFTDDYEQEYKSSRTSPWDGPHDFGVFNVEDGSLEPHYISEFKAITPAPIWIQPML